MPIRDILPAVFGYMHDIVGDETRGFRVGHLNYISAACVTAYYKFLKGRGQDRLVLVACQWDGMGRFRDFYYDLVDKCFLSFLRHGIGCTEYRLRHEIVLNYKGGAKGTTSCFDAFNSEDYIYSTDAHMSKIDIDARKHYAIKLEHEDLLEWEQWLMFD